MTRTRLNIFIEPAHAKRLDQVAAHKGVSKSAVIAAALAAFLSPEGEDQRQAAVTKRLDRLSRQFDRLERDQGVLIETFALYLRHYLTVALPVPEHQQEAMRAQGRARYAQFIEQLARDIQRGRSLIRDLHQDIEPVAPAPQREADGQTPFDTSAASEGEPSTSGEGEER